MFNIKKQSKLIFVMMLFLTLYGVETFYSIPKEDTPDIKIPMIYISIESPGISANDAERFILRPIERKLQGVQGIKKIQSNAINNYGNVTVEFFAGFDADKALTSVKDKVDEAKSDLPNGIKEPSIKEIDFSKFPVLNIGLFGHVSQAELITTGRKLKDIIQTNSKVLEVKLIGDRRDTMSITINPHIFKKYNISHKQIGDMVAGSNISMGAGFLQSKNASLVIDSDIVFKLTKDIKETPIYINDTVLRLKDIADVSKTYESPMNLAFINNRPAVVLEVSKRHGASIIETIDSIKQMVDAERKNIPSDINIMYSRDKSKYIIDSLEDLGNNLIFAFILVLIIIVSQIGKKQGIIVGMSIPISFFIGILSISLMGYTLNKIVLFALILASGMIVDASTIVVEYADRLMSKNEYDHKEAYYKAAQRMAVPVLSATITTLIVYLPLLFWPGIVGQFMKYIPITIISLLSASIVSALVFIPVLGSMFGAKTQKDIDRHKSDEDFNEKTETGDILQLPGFTGKYIKQLNKTIDNPKKFIAIVCGLFVASIIFFNLFGKGVAFFPKINATNAQIVIHSGGNLNIEQKIEMARKTAYDLVSKYKNSVKMIYTKVFGDIGPTGDQYSDDVISVIDMELEDWNKREQSSVIVDKMLKDSHNHPSGFIEILDESPGPRSGEKELQLEIMSRYQDKLDTVADIIYQKILEDKELKDVTINRPFERYQLDLNFDPHKASFYSLSPYYFADFVRMCTIGYKISSFRPDYSDESVDILIKFHSKYCTIEAIKELEVLIQGKSVKIGTVTEPKITYQVPLIKKINANIALKVSANPKPGVNITAKINEIQKWLDEQNFDSDVSFNFAGQSEDQKENGEFLSKAFLMAILIKTLILIGQFSSVYYALVMMSAIVLSIIGVLFGLVITSTSFGVVMCGLGIIALAGVVVSNNIILIDTYEKMIDSGMEIREAILRACAQRLRPILITAGTTVMGIFPMIYNIAIDFFHFKIIYNSPSGQWWEQLSTTIGFGMICATIFTLFFTPCCLMLYTPKQEAT